MPANARALHATDTYRRHANALRARAEAVTARNWQAVSLADLDATGATFTARATPALTQLQTAGARLSTGYLAAYLAVSSGRPPASIGSSAAAPAIGQSRAGKPLAEALAGPILTVKKAIGDGRDLPEALALGRDQAIRNAGEDVMFATRGTLFDSLPGHDEIVGWRRVTSGGCGACLALADGTIYSDETALEVHDGCQCTGEPVVRNVPDSVQRPTGRDIFDALPADQQDQLLGPDKARLVRDGSVPFHALVARSPMQAIADQITEAPLDALHAH